MNAKCTCDDDACRNKCVTDIGMTDVLKSTLGCVANCHKGFVKTSADPCDGSKCSPMCKCAESKCDLAACKGEPSGCLKAFECANAKCGCADDACRQQCAKDAGMTDITKEVLGCVAKNCHNIDDSDSLVV